MNFHILYRNLPMTYLLGAAHLRKLIPRTSHTCCEWSLCKELTGTSHARLESLSVHSSGWTLPRNRQDIQSKRCSRDERTAWNFNENPHSEFKVSFFVIMQEQAMFLRGAGSSTFMKHPRWLGSSVRNRLWRSAQRTRFWNDFNLSDCGSASTLFKCFFMMKIIEYLEFVICWANTKLHPDSFQTVIEFSANTGRYNLS